MRISGRAPPDASLLRHGEAFLSAVDSREFVLGVLLPAAVNLIWFVIFGGTAIHLALTQGVGIVVAVEASQASALFALLDQFRWPGSSALP